MNKIIAIGFTSLFFAGAAFPTMAADIKFDLVNNSARAIANFYTSAADTTN